LETASRPESATAPLAAHGPFVVVSPAGLDCEWLAGCLRKLDEDRPIVAVDPAELASCAVPLDGGLVVIDLDAPGCDGATTVRALAGPARQVVAIGSAIDDISIDRILLAGAWAYIPRSYTETQLLHVLGLVLEGAGHRPYFSGSSAFAGDAPCAGTALSGAAQEARAVCGDSKLTPKQVEVLSLAADGLSNKQIAVRLGISEGTVKLHMSAIYLKLNVERRGEAIVLARRMEEVRAQQVHRAERGAQVLDWLLPHVTHRHAARGEVIFRKADESHDLYYIQRGTVVLEEIGIEMGPGEVFGEIGLFSPQHARTCSVSCKTDVELFMLTSEQVKSVYYMNPQFALHIVQLISQRLLADRNRGP
jgi:DNA-binding NarL/FixJ family response regulator